MPLCNLKITTEMPLLTIFGFNWRGDRLNLYRDHAAAPVISSNVVPKKNALLANYPNPFNPETWIPYKPFQSSGGYSSYLCNRWQCDSDINVMGHQLAGGHIKAKAAQRIGMAKKRGLVNLLQVVSYFYTLSAGEFTATRKMLIRK